MNTPDTAADYGGAETVPQGTYTRPEQGTHYSDKGDHKERSLYHQPNHQKHWNKVERLQQQEKEP